MCIPFNFLYYGTLPGNYNFWSSLIDDDSVASSVSLYQQLKQTEKYKGLNVIPPIFENVVYQTNYL